MCRGFTPCDCGARHVGAAQDTVWGLGPFEVELAQELRNLGGVAGEHLCLELLFDRSARARARFPLRCYLLCAVLHVGFCRASSATAWGAHARDGAAEQGGATNEPGCLRRSARMTAEPNPRRAPIRTRHTPNPLKATKAAAGAPLHCGPSVFGARASCACSCGRACARDGTGRDGMTWDGMEEDMDVRIGGDARRCAQP